MKLKIVYGIRIIFLNTEWSVCKERALARGIDWCTGREAQVGSGPRVVPLNVELEKTLDAEVKHKYKR